MRKISNILIAIAVALTAIALAACSDELPTEQPSVPDDSVVGIDLALTRSTSGAPLGDRTYRVLLFNTTYTLDDKRKATPHRRYTGLQGTYHDDGTAGVTSVLKPWNLETNSYDPQAGLYVKDYDYNMVIVSPAKPISVLGDIIRYYYDESDPLNKHYTDEVIHEDDLIEGFQIERIPPTGEKSFYVSEFIPITISGRGENYQGEKKPGETVAPTIHRDTIHVDEKQNSILVGHHSRARFTFKCHDILTEAKVRKVMLKNMPVKAYWSPNFNRFVTRNMDFGETTLYDGATVTLTSAGKETLTVPDDSHADLTDGGKYYTQLLANDEVVAVDGVYEYTPLTLHVNFYDDVKFDFPIQMKFEPHHTYDFTVTISTIYIDISLTVSPWTDGNAEEGDASFGNPPEPETIDLGHFTISGWNDATGSNGSTTVGDD